MTNTETYSIPPRWCTPGPDVPPGIEAMLPWIRSCLKGHGSPTGEGYILREIDSVGGHSSIHRLENGATGYCVKVYPDDRRIRAPREWVGLQVLREFGFPRAPRAYALSVGEESTFLVMEWMQGFPLGERHLTRPQLGALAEMTKTLHAIDPAKVGEPLWPCLGNPRDCLRVFPKEIALLKKSPDERAIEAASLAQVWLDSGDPQVLLEPGPQVFSHGDPNLANCLWDGDHLWVVDLEDAGWRDPMIDLAFVTEHIQARRTPHDEWQWFVDQFQLSRKERRRLLAAQRQDALDWLFLAFNEPRRVRSLPAGERLDILLDRVRFVCSQTS